MNGIAIFTVRAPRGAVRFTGKDALLPQAPVLGCPNQRYDRQSLVSAHLERIRLFPLPPQRERVRVRANVFRPLTLTPAYRTGRPAEGNHERNLVTAFSSEVLAVGPMLCDSSDGFWGRLHWFAPPDTSCLLDQPGPLPLGVLALGWEGVHGPPLKVL